MSSAYLEPPVIGAERLGQRVGLPPVSPEDTVPDRGEGVGVPSHDVLEVREEGPAIDGARLADSDHGVDGHGVVQVQEERQPLLRGELGHVRPLQFLNQVRVPE